MLTPTDEIKAKLDIVDVVQEYVKLKQSGANWKAKCPFHTEKTPSFMVSRDKQIWHCFGCFPQGALIKTVSGLVPIEKIKRGNYLISGQGQRRKVLLTMRRDYQGQLITLQVRKCSQLVTMTADHKVPVIRTVNCKQKGRRTRICQAHCRQNCSTKYFKDYKIEKVKAGELTKNDYLLYPVNQEIKDVKIIDLNNYLSRRLTNYGPKIKRIPTKVKVDSSFLKLVGYYLAEGSSHRAYIRFSLGPQELAFAQEIQKLVKKIFKLESSIHVRKKGKTGIEVSCCNSNLANIFENLCGRGAGNKQIPRELNYLPPKKQLVILEAIFKGDGYVSQGGQKSRGGEKVITLISRNLIDQLKDILLRLGFQPTLNYQKAKKDKKGVKHQAAYTLRWRRDLQANYSDFFTDQGIKYWLLPIRNIKKSKFKGEVYNLTVATDHSYIANHFAVGNCGEGGDVFTFIQKVEGVEFPEALRILANKAGVVLKKQDPVITNQRTRLLDINELIAKYYHKVLLESPVAQKARDYLKSRNIDEITIDQWQLGFAPDSWEETTKFLKKKGFSEEEIFLAGLLVKKERGVGFYDRFRNRLMFPIWDQHGHVVGFSARSLDPEAAEAKYINTPQTMIFNKSQLLFGLDKAKSEIRNQKLAVVVEGNTDVITSHQFGVKNVVASCGTALTIDQVRLLKRYSENIALSFDPDAAGEIAAKRGIDVALQQGLNVKLIELPVGEDPDNFIKNNSVADWQEKIKQAKPVMEYYFAKEVANKNLDDAQEKKRIVQVLLPVIAKIADQVEQIHWLQKLADILKVPENILREALVKLIKKVGPQKEETPVLHSAMSRQEKESERLLALLLNYPDNLVYAIEHITPESLFGVKVERLYTDLIVYYNNNKDQPEFSSDSLIENFSSNLDKELVDYLNQLTLLIQQDIEELTPEKVKDEVIKIIRDLKKDYIISQLKKLGEQLKQAEAESNSEEVKNLSEQFSQLTDQLHNLS